MAQRSFLGDMLTTLFERRAADAATGDERSLTEMCLALLDAEGEVSGIKLAQAILDRYAHLAPSQKLEFFTFLNEDLEIDVDALTRAVADFSASRAASQPYLNCSNVVDSMRN